MSTGTKHRLLIVDDESDLRNLLGEILGPEGYEITTASDGDEAIGILEKETFDVVLLDIMMPKRNGFEVLKHITHHYPRTKTVMLTGYTDLKSAVVAREHGAVEFITKPYKIQSILEALQRVLSA